MATISERGFTPITTQELVDKIAEKAKQEYGEGFPTSPESVFGVHTGIISATQTDLVQLLQWAVNQQNRKYAEGVYLDYMGKWVGLDRQQAVGSVGFLSIVSTAGYTIPLGTEFKASSVENLRVQTTEEYTANPTGSYEVFFGLESIAAQNYNLFINGINATYTATGTDTATDILTALKAAVDAVHITNYTTTIVDDQLHIVSNTVNNNTRFVNGSNVTLPLIGNVVKAITLQTGEIVVNPSVIDQPVIPDTQIYSVSNPSDFVLGRPLETDQEFRERLEQKEQSTGTATIPAIRSKISEVSGVSKVFIRENSSFEVDESSRPRKSYECFVAGGLEQDIAEAIWISKPAGIELWGGELTTITDEEGQVQPIRFSRFQDRYAWLQINLSLNPEEDVEATAQDAIRTSVVNQGSLMKDGEDLAPSKFYGSVYSAAEGYYVESIQVAITDNKTDTPAYSTARLPVTVLQNLIFDGSRVEIIVA